MVSTDAGRLSLFSVLDQSDPHYQNYLLQEKMLFEAVGFAISTWAEVEYVVVHCCMYSLDRTAPEALEILSEFKSFAVIVNFTDRAFKQRLKDPQELSFWNSWVQYVRELSGDRNHLAHSPRIVHTGDVKGEKPSLRHATPKIGPAFDGIILGNIKRDAVDALEVMELIKDFREAAFWAWEYLRAKKSGEPLHGKFLKPIQRRRPPLVERRANSRKKPASPPQSSP